MNFAIFAFLSFISGSIPFGYWIALRFGKMDIRKFGSKNIGATNVGRSIGWKFGFPVLVLDVAKGIFPVYLSGIYIPEGGVPFQLACGVLAVLGHMFSPFLGFKGGKGVATTLGVFLVLTPIACFGAIFVFLVTIKYFKFVSIGSIFASLTLPLVYAFSSILLLHEEVSYWILGTMVFISIGIILTHRENIFRILNRSELFAVKNEDEERNGDSERNRR
ncbi:glycerol-3-phosphate 1-O-acyltransferase PlsY [Leptospira borgpetersenii]|uniref:Glycerol-3-phosphate acyltransferase n=3 Tax=Leptospira borgpetersenii serovar Hardjo-bovis TaxID=338217 RepID=PLSY_LEPBJ|nr:glycerol-3-phosphate 1-O-acyltransferase PlsY [Leptospira borgpetersenii]Q04TV3.1 RecName: Full=Glycerol-3-phosphate acyltransferase; AltName: Full=Acyl-PO4 G3P acyltransferase; AltName: Full=Acyl-phosphate--glycerol-3-phosphate acyltransferase; AltName: Full=G3P acyltransferase; Short=GPAT; AltName: Full=Lysophosphatidic acid synthase; Short=LPA synthase [Leptospira borgpetersenii serovar Hardjo-bovis str. JB197]Q04ZS2.1 RecName: Full=Glycerol-3-phosphate acyltransferase; AltName: Full=Acyl-P